MSDWIDLFNGRDLNGWTANGEHIWRVAGGVALQPDNDRLLLIETGTGVMVKCTDAADRLSRPIDTATSWAEQRLTYRELWGWLIQRALHYAFAWPVGA